MLGNYLVATQLVGSRVVLITIKLVTSVVHVINIFSTCVKAK
jgi:hypothetical protein